MDGWESWAQQVGAEYLKARTTAQYQQPYEIQKLKLQAYGPYGDLYQEGQPGIQGAAMGGIPMTWLLIGAVIVAVVALKD